MTAPARGAWGTRGWLWLQLLIGWLPVWALYAAMIVVAHGEPVMSALLAAARAIAGAAALGLLVLRLIDRLPWPRPLRTTFVLVHVLASVGYAAAWVTLTSAIESALHGRTLVIAPPGAARFLLLGIWLYIAVAGVSYAVRATERAARAEATAARSQLAALRSQLNPHFLFNALHTVVQLIPTDPRQAADAAERLAELLRTAIEEDRDLVPLVEERAFVERYLDLERLRFGDRLRVEFDVSEAAAEALVPPFALQTLVENAVRHGAAPRVEPTRITISGQVRGDSLSMQVSDDGVGAEVARVEGGTGTGIRRLRERLDALYGSRARLQVTTGHGPGFRAILTLPFEADGAAG